jgi:hypothetical protein
MQANPRYFYSEYVNHMIRFFLSCPDSLTMDGHTKVDVLNWLSVQAVWAELSEEDRRMIRSLYETRQPYAEAVQRYSEQAGVKPNSVWQSVVRISNKIARQRGLI